ncbi:hypothetical protein LTR56_026253 [Elasticomyces elasticus]|nr:hypothetical protein LTR56_026253 [Elasticomyces elasticus]KAK3619049.1 hypothetical protein LTR22_026126 [Elasticomyces elasticus]KAK5729704.1 hypothetical protein LTS12_027311 [Elasticomyces elasticus]
MDGPILPIVLAGDSLCFWIPGTVMLLLRISWLSEVQRGLLEYCSALATALAIVQPLLRDPPSLGRGGKLVTHFVVHFNGSEDLYGMINMLTAAAPSSEGLFTATGDKMCALTILDQNTGTLKVQLRAHSSEISDIRIFQRSSLHLLATASRDRTILLFASKDGNLELLQTMDEHAGSVTSLLATENGAYQLSCSASRSVVVREAWLRDADDPASVAYVILRTITLTSAPTSMCIGADQNTLLVATTDHSVTQFSIKIGQTSFTFKFGDPEGEEAVALSRFLYTPMLNGNSVIVGISSTDKSVRLYSDFGTLLAGDWGHTEGVTEIALLPAEGAKAPRLVTVAG